MQVQSFQLPERRHVRRLPSNERRVRLAAFIRLSIVSHEGSRRVSNVWSPWSDRRPLSSRRRNRIAVGGLVARGIHCANGERIGRIGIQAGNGVAQRRSGYRSRERASFVNVVPGYPDIIGGRTPGQGNRRGSRRSIYLKSRWCGWGLGVCRRKRGSLERYRIAGRRSIACGVNGLYGKCIGSISCESCDVIAGGRGACCRYKRGTVVYFVARYADVIGGGPPGKRGSGAGNVGNREIGRRAWRRRIDGIAAAAKVGVNDIVESIGRVRDFPYRKNDLITGSVRHRACVRIGARRLGSAIADGAERSQIEGIARQWGVRIPVLFGNVIFPACRCMWG